MKARLARNIRFTRSRFKPMRPEVIRLGRMMDWFTSIYGELDLYVSVHSDSWIHWQYVERKMHLNMTIRREFSISEEAIDALWVWEAYL